MQRGRLWGGHFLQRIRSSYANDRVAILEQPYEQPDDFRMFGRLPKYSGNATDRTPIATAKLPAELGC